MASEPHLPPDITEETDKEDEVNIKLDIAASNLWNKFQSMASFVAEKVFPHTSRLIHYISCIQTVEIGKTCGEEMAQFADDVKMEASDIYKDHLADKVHNIKESLPKMIPNSLLTYVEGVLPHTEPEEMPLEPLETTK